MSISLKELAERIGADLTSVPEAVANKTITGVNSLRKASSTEISFLSSEAHLEDVQASQAAAVVVSADHAEGCPLPAVVHEQPYIAYALISAIFAPARPQDGVHSSAVISEGAKIGAKTCIAANTVVHKNTKIADEVTIGANVSIGENVTVGRGTLIHPNVCIYRDVIIGEDCILHAGTVIGSDGFGFAPSAEGWIKIHQLGSVRIGNGVEIGSNCSIDRGALEDTLIADGVKIDNLVHLAHNVQIGENTAIAGQVGVAGSTKIGKNCMFAGQAGVAGHVELTDGVTVTGQGMITKSIKNPGVYSSGTSFSESSRWRKSVVRFQQLDSMFKRLAKLEKKFEEK